MITALVTLLVGINSIYSQDLSVDQIYGTILMHHFEEKNHSIVNNTIIYFKEKKAVDNSMQYCLAGFYSELFKDKVIKEEILNGIDSLELVEVSDFFHWISDFNNDEFYNTSVPNPNINDMYWSSYFASGNTKYLDYVINTAIKYKDERKDISLFLAGQSAVWSLSSNSKQYNTVKEHIINCKELNKDLIEYILTTDPQSIQNETVKIIKTQRDAGIWK
jgi:hypothetical protein